MPLTRENIRSLWELSEDELRAKVANREFGGDTKRDVAILIADQKKAEREAAQRAEELGIGRARLRLAEGANWRATAALVVSVLAIIVSAIVASFTIPQ